MPEREFTATKKSDASYYWFILSWAVIVVLLTTLVLKGSSQYLGIFFIAALWLSIPSILFRIYAVSRSNSSRITKVILHADGITVFGDNQQEKLLFVDIDKIWLESSQVIFANRNRTSNYVVHDSSRDKTIRLPDTIEGRDELMQAIIKGSSLKLGPPQTLTAVASSLIPFGAWNRYQFTQWRKVSGSQPSAEDLKLNPTPGQFGREFLILLVVVIVLIAIMVIAIKLSGVGRIAN